MDREDPQTAQPAAPAPATSGKWLHASVTDEAAAVIAAGFSEADRRDPDHARTWIALVDGNSHQIDRIHTAAQARKITIPIVGTSSTSSTHGPHWRPLEPRRRRSHPQAPHPHQQRRLRPVLDLAPRPGTTRTHNSRYLGGLIPQ
jgi:hypothetical protein